MKIWFSFQKAHYNWDFEEKCFKGIKFPINFSYQHYIDWKGYQSDEEIKDAEANYGKNEYILIIYDLLEKTKIITINILFGFRLEMVVPEFMELFLERATAPFFVFQVFCVCLWCLDAYW